MPDYRFFTIIIVYPSEQEGDVQHYTAEIAYAGEGERKMRLAFYDALARASAMKDAYSVVVWEGSRQLLRINVRNW